MQAELAKLRGKERPYICRNGQKVFLLSFSQIIKAEQNNYDSAYYLQNLPLSLSIAGALKR
jgi:hypothetical protein